MKRRDEVTAKAFAEDIASLMPLARRAYGQQKTGTPAREASDTVNGLLLEFDSSGGNLTELAELLDGVIGLPGLRRRLRVARAGIQLGQPTGRSFRGSRDPVRVGVAVERLRAVRDTPEYGKVMREVYNSGIALTSVAEQLGVTYYAAWAAMTTNAPPPPPEAEATANEAPAPVAG